MYIFSAEILFSFLTLSALEIVLGIDNLIFIALLVQDLPRKIARKVRLIGLSLAFAIRVIMLFGITWVMSLTSPVLSFASYDFSFKDLLLIAGGLFLIIKSAAEIHSDIKKHEPEHKPLSTNTGFIVAIIQVALIDFIFSFDSIITAVGLTTQTAIIICAIVVSMLVMLLASGYISGFIKKHPRFKMLAIIFILVVGIMLIAEGLHLHIPHVYVYVAFAVAIFVETLNTIARNNKPWV